MKLSTRWQCPTATLRPNKHPHGQSMCYWLLNIEGQDRLGQPWPIWCLAIGPCSKQLHWNWVLRVGFHVNCLRNCHSHNDPCPHHHTYAPSWDIGNEDEQLQRQPQRWWRKNISANNRDSAFDAGTYSQPPSLTTTVNKNAGDDALRPLKSCADHWATASSSAVINLTGNLVNDDNDDGNDNEDEDDEIVFRDSSTKNGRQANKINLCRDGGNDDGNDVSHYRQRMVPYACRQPGGQRVHRWACAAATGGKILFTFYTFYTSSFSSCS